MQVTVVSIFPSMVDAVAGHGVVGRAVDAGLLRLSYRNPRDFTDDAHRTVDDRPYGGGPGMVMKYAPLAAAIGAAKRSVPDGSPVVYLSPQGRKFDQSVARRYAGLPGLVLLAGRYEGIDQRLIEREVDEELSLGDFVLSGGEIAAMAVIDAVARLLPGVLGDETSADQDSFSAGLLDHPHYTRPEVVEGQRVPDVLLSGDHAKIARWRRKQSVGRSFARRPDLVRTAVLDEEQKRLLQEYLADSNEPAGAAAGVNKDS